MVSETYHQRGLTAEDEVMGVGMVATGTPDFEPECVMCDKVRKGEYEGDDHHSPKKMPLFRDLANGKVPNDVL